MDVEEGKLEEELVDKPGNHDRYEVIRVAFIVSEYRFFMRCGF